jgi:undecaprenyl-diphosphatase
MIVLGVVQGATEFLPVSSSAHLTVFQELFGIQENRVFFDIFLHAGTLIAIFLVFGKHIIQLFSRNRKWIRYLALATVPAVVVGLALESKIERVFGNITVVGALLIANGFILLAGNAATGRLRKNSQDAGEDACGTLQVNAKKSLLVGAAQALAILPGISRSGSTVCSGLLVGWKREIAVRFSFLLAIPVMLGVCLRELWKSRSLLAADGVGTMALTGLVVAAVVGYAALRLFLRVVEKGKLWIFAAYTFSLGAAILVWQLVK